MILNQYFRHRKKIFRGIRARFSSTNQKEYAQSWWDQHFYTTGLSDSKTISSRKSPVSARYHYSSIEKILLRHFLRFNCAISGKKVLDIGSGSGHWIDMYLELGAESVTGVDVSEKSVEHIRDRYVSDGRVQMFHGDALDSVNRSEEFHVVNAIGVMFHIVDDEQWKKTIEHIGAVTEKGGVFIVGGHFGWMNGLNVQVDKHGVNKRLRSVFEWKRHLKDAGFREIRVYKNWAYLSINEMLPENNILIARK